MPHDAHHHEAMTSQRDAVPSGGANAAPTVSRDNDAIAHPGEQPFASTGAYARSDSAPTMLCLGAGQRLASVSVLVGAMWALVAWATG